MIKTIDTASYIGEIPATTKSAEHKTDFSLNSYWDLNMEWNGKLYINLSKLIVVS